MDFKLFINFKTYSAGSGAEAVKLAKVCRAVSLKKKVSIIPIVQALDAYRVLKEADISPWIQHLDEQESGAYTGWINLETAVATGAVGTLLNHSEHPIPPGKIKQVLKRVAMITAAGNHFAHQGKQAFTSSQKITLPPLGEEEEERLAAGNHFAHQVKQISTSSQKITSPPREEEGQEGMGKRSFSVMIGAKTLGQVERLAKLRADYLAYEPAELIGGKVSVSQAKPKAIKKAVKICHSYSVPLIVGAGIHNSEDVLAAKKMGAVGVLVSSAVVLAKDPRKKIEEMIKNRNLDI